MAEVVLGLGSNLGDAANSIRRAVFLLQEVLRIQAISSLYFSAPMYRFDQEPFKNAVLVGHTDTGPLTLLHRIKKIESDMGRKPRARNGPREIDIDIVAYGSLRYEFRDNSEVKLKIPHPRAFERRFVLLPLLEIAPEFDFAGLGTAKEHLAKTESQDKDVRRLENEILSIYGPR